MEQIGTICNASLEVLETPSAAIVDGLRMGANVDEMDGLKR